MQVKVPSSRHMSFAIVLMQYSLTMWACTPQRGLRSGSTNMLENALCNFEWQWSFH
jgi:hypothetical protein